MILVGSNLELPVHNGMKYLLQSGVLSGILLFCTLLMSAEGTKQIMPIVSSKGQLCLDKSRNNFGFYDAAPEFRLHVTIASNSEAIRFGFGDVIGGTLNLTSLTYRIKNPNGVVVYGPTPVPTSGPGFIATYNEAVVGPFPASGGYNYLLYQPLMKGDYYFEFYYPPVNNVYLENNRRTLRYFDITVVDVSGAVKNGRVWSKAWQFWSENPNAPPTENRFYGKLMVLSADSIVTQVNCNGFIGGTFSFSCNSTGCANTGSLSFDRRSRDGFYTNPEYKVFLNDPDSTLFPTAKITSGIKSASITPLCETGGALIHVSTIKDGTVKVLIDVNPNPGQDAEDVFLIDHISAAETTPGANTIWWNGNDGLGRPVLNGTVVRFNLTFLSGMTHLPIYDIEYNDNGYLVEQVRPKGQQLRIFWDDTSLFGGTSDTLTGCIIPSGCHSWINNFGNNRTLNSWWFVTFETYTSAPFTTRRSPGNINFFPSVKPCVGAASKTFSIIPEGNSTSYRWSYTGSGVTIKDNGTSVELIFGSKTTPGFLRVNGVNTCGDGPMSQQWIDFEPLPNVRLENKDICYTLPVYVLSGGTPEGGTYYLNGLEADTIFPYREPYGVKQITYVYTDIYTGCSNVAKGYLHLSNSTECEGSIEFPNAFSPNNDGNNDLFMPVLHNIYKLSLQIFNRYGQMVYSTDHYTSGWDGTFKGQPAPAGIYAYAITYYPSLREDIFRMYTGVVLLIR